MKCVVIIIFCISLFTFIKSEDEKITLQQNFTTASPNQIKSNNNIKNNNFSEVKLNLSVVDLTEEQINKTFEQFGVRVQNVTDIRKESILLVNPFNTSTVSDLTKTSEPINDEEETPDDSTLDVYFNDESEFEQTGLKNKTFLNNDNTNDKIFVTQFIKTTHHDPGILQVFFKDTRNGTNEENVGDSETQASALGNQNVVEGETQVTVEKQLIVEIGNTNDTHDPNATEVNFGRRIGKARRISNKRSKVHSSSDNKNFSQEDFQNSSQHLPHMKQDRRNVPDVFSNYGNAHYGPYAGYGSSFPYNLEINAQAQTNLDASVQGGVEFKAKVDTSAQAGDEFKGRFDGFPQANIGLHVNETYFQGRPYIFNPYEHIPRPFAHNQHSPQPFQHRDVHDNEGHPGGLLGAHGRGHLGDHLEAHGGGHRADHFVHREGKHGHEIGHSHNSEHGLPRHTKHLSADGKTLTITKEIPVPYTVKIEKQVPYVVYKKVPIDRPYPVVVHKPYKIYHPVEHKFDVRIRVPKPYEVVKHVPKPVKVPVYHPYPVPVPRPYPVTVEKKVPVTVEKKVPYPVHVPVDRPYPVHVPVEKHVPYPVEKKVPVAVNVPVDKPYPVYIPKPYTVHVPKPVPHTVEKHVPYEVKVPVRVPVKVPVPYEVVNHVPEPHHHSPHYHNGHHHGHSGHHDHFDRDFHF